VNQRHQCKVAARRDKTSLQTIVLIMIGDSCTMAYSNIQFVMVERLFAPALMRTDVTCTGYSQVMPSRPTTRVSRRKIITVAPHLRTFIPIPCDGQRNLNFYCWLTAWVYRQSSNIRNSGITITSNFVVVITVTLSLIGVFMLFFAYLDLGS
jgi:hypothetical protein